MNLLLTSIGKRIQLIGHLKTAFRVVGADASEQNAAKYFVDAFYRIPRCSEPAYLSEILAICDREEINALIPLYEAEFSVLNEARRLLEAKGVRLILSEKRVIEICNDKRKTAIFFKQYGIPAPKTYREEEIESLLQAEQEAEGIYPLIIKPLDGMGSENVFKAENRGQLDFFYHYVKKPVVQSCAIGTEYTIDVLCDGQGIPVYVVPRIRMEVRSGEVVKSRAVRQEDVVRETIRLLEALNGEGRVIGPMTVQCFLSEAGEVSFIEINPRFGGGVPLSFAAGADYGAALAGMCRGECRKKRRTEDYLGDFAEKTMLRYDQAVFED